MTSNNNTADRTRTNGAWFKSTFSNPNGNECVEVRFGNEHVQVRDTKDNETGPILTINAQYWPGFLAEALGHTPPGSNQAAHIAHSATGDTQLHASDGHAHLTFTHAEWDAFTTGITDGQFTLPETANPQN